MSFRSNLLIKFVNQNNFFILRYMRSEIRTLVLVISQSIKFVGYLGLCANRNMSKK